jgi:hypothetical protein
VKRGWKGGDEGGVPEVNASWGKVGKLKSWSGICAALACVGSTGCWEERTSVLELRYGAAISASLKFQFLSWILDFGILCSQKTVVER